MRHTSPGALVVCCAVMAAALPVCRALSKPPDFETFQAERTTTVERLTAKGTANALAAAALLKQFGEEGDTGSYALAAKAVDLAPERRDLAWLAVRLCNTVADCDPAKPEQHLRDVDPANGVGFVGVLARAQLRNDVPALDAALTSIGDSERFYVYFNPLAAAVAPEVAEAHHPNAAGKLSRKDQTDAWTEVTGVAAATLLPPLQPISLACKGMALQIEGRLDRCRRAARTFAQADTFIAEGLGLSLQQRLWPEDSAEGRAVTARRRVYQYRLEEFNRLDAPSSNQARHLSERVDLRRTHDREQDAALELLVKARVPVDPPPGWMSSTPPRVP